MTNSKVQTLKTVAVLVVGIWLYEVAVLYASRWVVVLLAPLWLIVGVAFLRERSKHALAARRHGILDSGRRSAAYVPDTQPFPSTHVRVFKP